MSIKTKATSWNMRSFAKNHWDRLVLVLILATTVFLTFYSIHSEGYGNEYYAATVKSMLQSWHNFFYASFDPTGYVTVDKPALGLWLQAASAFVFGYHGWSLILPEMLSTLVSAVVLFHLVKRSFGRVAGLLSTLALGLTPILVAVSRTNNLDASLLMLLMLGTWALILAAERGSFGYLVLSMMFVGLGFNVKMLQAFMVLPAFYAVYLLTAPLRARVKFAHLSGATAVLMTVSLLWAVVVDLTPAKSRPYIGSSSSNSVVELALGYNGIQRITGTQNAGSNSNGTPGMGMPPGSTQQDDRQQPHSDGQNSFQGTRSTGFQPGTMNDGRNGGMNGNGGPGGEGENGTRGVFRIFNKQLSGQITWLLPLAFFGALILVFGIADNRKRTSEADSVDYHKKTPKDSTIQLRSLILWVGWIIPMLCYFSIAGFFHRYYLSMLAPGIAALVGIGLVQMWKAYMSSGFKWIFLPLALLSTAALQALILSSYSEWHLLIPVVCGLTALAALLLIVIRLTKKDHLTKTIKLSIAVGFLALIISPAIWAATPLVYGSQSQLPIAGPELNGDRSSTAGRFRGGVPSQNGAVWDKDSASIGIKQGSSNTLSSSLVKYLTANKGAERYLLAVSDVRTAQSIIINTDLQVIAVGGFSGSDKIMTLPRLKEMVAKGELRYFMLGGQGRGTQSELTQWVMDNGKAVTIDSSSTTQDSSFFHGRMDTSTIYDLKKTL